MRSITGTLTDELKKLTNSKNVALDEGYKINNYGELVEQIAKLSFLNKDHLLFFRGQNNDYKNKVKKSTFYPSIYRDSKLSESELKYRFTKLESASKMLIELFREQNIAGRDEIRKKKLIQWSILQHYEVTSTPLLDLTQSLRVACSFAQLKNKEKTSFVYIFGLPYLTNRISINSEHDLVNIRLLSISPPQALRPYYQEGYMVGTSDITDEYDDKSELDLNNRLIAKFEIPSDDSFWGEDFQNIPENAIYPKNDIIKNICDRIKNKIPDEVGSSELGNFLKLWTEIEVNLINRARKYNRNVHNLVNAINLLLRSEEENYSMLKEFDQIRKFRNNLVHNPVQISNKDLAVQTPILQNLLNNLKKI